MTAKTNRPAKRTATRLSLPEAVTSSAALIIIRIAALASPDRPAAINISRISTGDSLRSSSISLALLQGICLYFLGDVYWVRDHEHPLDEVLKVIDIRKHRRHNEQTQDR